MRLPTRAALAAASTLALACAAAAGAQESDTVSMAHDPAKYGIVVSATRTPTRQMEIPNGTAIVRGDDLRRRGAQTVADALIDVLGIDTGGGSDNGSRLPNIGMWGLKEFDALLITVDGVPIGGPFNPSLSQISADDIDRIEIVKGPQGSLYGVSGFAGMVQVFTGGNATEGVTGSAGGGSFGDVHGRAAMHHAAGDWALDAVLSGGRADGWQDRTASRVERGRASLSGGWDKTRLSLDVVGLADHQDWGTPVPYDPDAGEPLPGFKPENNLAVGGAEVEHNVWSLNSHLSTPVPRLGTLHNTLSATRDHQSSIRSFLSSPPDPSGTFSSAGVQLEPIETSFYEDLSLVSGFDLAGRQELVAGAAVTWGRTTAEGIGFDFDQVQGDPASIPDWESVPVGDHRSFADRRTFYGLYAHDSWTPARAFTLSGGGRWDRTEEKLHAFGQEVGGPAAIADDSRHDSAWSGDIAGLLRLVPDAGAGALDAANLYANWKSSFKPAAPNLTEAESARILDPERTHSVEGGLKGQAFDRQLAFDVSAFQIDFHNLVVSTLGPGGTPELINAGHERFQGVEGELTLAPSRLRGLSITAGYAHHDPKLIQFQFVDPGTGELVDVSGNFVELAPRELMNAKVAYAPERGLGAWATVRHQGKRPFDKDNVAYMTSFEEYDAGVSFVMPRFRVTASGRNLGDSRRVAAESEIGDAMYYIAPPRHFSGEVTVTF